MDTKNRRRFLATLTAAGAAGFVGGPNSNAQDGRRGRLPLPPPRNLPWPLKPVESAKTSLIYDEFGRMVMHIEHDLLKGITAEMVAWWFGNIGGDMEVEGFRLNKYLVWHPLDHIHWQLAQPGADGRASAGA